MIESVLTAHRFVADALSPLGMEKFAGHAMFLGLCLGLALLRAAYVSLRYRPLTEEEIEELSHRPDCFHILERGRIPRW